jgi:hypothetical protein
MNIYEIVVTEFNDDFVKYTYSSGSNGMSGKKWFPGVQVGQVGALVVKSVRVQ